MEKLLAKKQELLKQREDIDNQLAEIDKQIETNKKPLIEEMETKHLPVLNIGNNINLVKQEKVIKGRKKTDYNKVADWLVEQGLKEVVDNNTKITIRVSADIAKEAKKAIKAERPELLEMYEAILDTNTTKGEDRVEVSYNIIKIGA